MDPLLTYMMGLLFAAMSVFCAHVAYYFFTFKL